MHLRYRVVDVFSDRPLAGNPLCVVLDECPPDRMQAIAREMNLSETTFPTTTAADAYSMRIFTPTAELPFAGHPSIGTAWVLGPRRWTQTTAGATVTVDADEAGARMSQPDPTFREVRDGWIAEAAGNSFFIQPFDGPIDAVGPAALTGSDDAFLWAALRAVDEQTLEVRAFVIGPSGFEDPGTGSLAGPAALLAHRLFGTAIDVVVQQGDHIGRPCRIDVHAEEGEVRVGGRVAACAEGTLTI